jgi:hypothetical protein
MKIMMNLIINGLNIFEYILYINLIFIFEFCEYNGSIGKILMFGIKS